MASETKNYSALFEKLPEGSSANPWKKSRGDIILKYVFPCKEINYFTLKIAAYLQPEKLPDIGNISHKTYKHKIEGQFSGLFFNITINEGDDPMLTGTNEIVSSSLTLTLSELKSDGHRSFFNELQYGIEQILESEKLKERKHYKKLIGCKCLICANPKVSERNFFDLSELQERYNTDNVDAIRCRISNYEDILISKILEGMGYLSEKGLDEDRVRLLLTDDNIEEAIKLLRASSSDSETKITLDNYLARLNSGQRERQQGLLSREDYNTERNQIRMYLLEMINPDNQTIDEEE